MTTIQFNRLLSIAIFVVIVLLGMVVSPAMAEKESDEGSVSSAASAASLEEKVEILTEEVSRLREQMNIPETDKQLEGMYGMGPAASKVYGVSQGISFGGYGEFYFASPYGETDITGQVNTTDFYRFIAYFGYKFTDWIVMNTEIEYEHATTSSNYAGKSGSVSVEFSYLDFLFNAAINARGGNILVPMGFVNLMHEPPTYWGNIRPFVETTIIPSTWREMGLGVHGSASGARYSAYVMNGLNAERFDDKGVRGGRQAANRAIWEDIGAVASLDYLFKVKSNGAVQLGGSVFAGGADQNLVENADGERISVNNQIYELHAELRKGGFKTRVLGAASHISNAGALSAALFTDEGTGMVTKQVPENQIGWYLEAGYDVAPHLTKGARFTLTPWVRYEKFNLQDSVAGSTGLPPNPALDGALMTVGLECKPHPNVVVKLDLVHPTNKSDKPVSDEIRFGAGFIY